MILLDTNVIIDAHCGVGNDQVRARNLISSAILDSGAAINCVTLAELYTGPKRGEEIEDDMRRAGIVVLDLPVDAAAICGRAYRRYRLARTRSGGGKAPSMPLPDFFIGARRGKVQRGRHRRTRWVCWRSDISSNRSAR